MFKVIEVFKLLLLTKADIAIGGNGKCSVIKAKDKCIRFKMHLPEGSTHLWVWFTDASGTLYQHTMFMQQSVNKLYKLLCRE